MNAMNDLIACCGVCGSEDLHMTTCDEVHGTGHEWALASICHGCQEVYIAGRCYDCEGEEED